MAPRRRADPKPSSRAAVPQPGGLVDYLDVSARPLQSLLFLAPLIVAYQVGTFAFATNEALGETHYIKAFSLLHDFFQIFGITGVYLPGLLVVSQLLSMHWVAGHPARARLSYALLMGVESCLLAIPLLMLALVLFRPAYVDPPRGADPLVGPVDRLVLPGEGGWSDGASLAPPAAGEASFPPGAGPVASLPMLASPLDVTSHWPTLITFSIGAGIYEELLFRVIGLAAIHALLAGFLALPERTAAVGAIVGSAVLFAAYHFPSLSAFSLLEATFYVLAGLYFAYVYFHRGFGVVAGTHAMYDVIVVSLPFLQSGAGQAG